MKTDAGQQQSLFLFEELTLEPPPVAGPRYRAGTLYKVPVDRLKPDPAQPRSYFDEEAQGSLAESVRQQGVMQPVLFRIDEAGEPVLVAGERRWRAAGQAGLKTVPGLLVDGDPLEIAMVENTLREELTAVELAESLNRLRELRGYGLDRLALLIGKAISTVSEILSLNRLPAAIRDDCRSNPAIPRDLLVRIARAGSEEEMWRLYENFVVKGSRHDQLKTARQSLRPVKFSAMTKLLSSYNEKVGRLDVANLKPRQKNVLKPVLQKAIADLSALLERIDGE